MALYRPKTKYTLAEDHDIQGKIWPKGATIYAVDVPGAEPPRVDLFFTHKSEYAKRGSHAPVYRTPKEYVVVEGETLRISNPNADEQE